jgi:hypothetical protein
MKKPILAKSNSLHLNSEGLDQSQSCLTLVVFANLNFYSIFSKLLKCWFCEELRAEVILKDF